MGALVDLQRSFAYRLSNWAPQFVQWIDAVSDFIDTFVGGVTTNLDAVVGLPGSSSLRGRIPLVDESAIVEGYYAPGDGGGGTFFWLPTSVLADNGGTVINPTGHVGPGRWIRIWQGTLSGNGMLDVRWFGAKGDNVTDDAPAIRATITALNMGVVYMPAGIYLVRDELPGKTSVFFQGDGQKTTYVNRQAGGATTECFLFTDTDACGASGMTVVSSIGNCFRIHAATKNITYPVFKDIDVAFLETPFAAFELEATFPAFIFFPYFENINIDGGASATGRATIGFNFIGTSNTVGLNSFGGRITRVGTGLECLQCETSLFDGLAIDGCTNAGGTGTGIHVGPGVSTNYNCFINLRLEANEIQWKLDAGPAAGGTQIHCRLVAPPPTPAQTINNQFAAISGVDPTNGRNNRTSFALEISALVKALFYVSGALFTEHAGTPEAAVTAVPGSLVVDTTNGDVYVKHTGVGNTGWALLAAAATAGTNGQQLTTLGTTPTWLGITTQALGNASVTITVGNGNQAIMPAATMSVNRTVTLGTAGAVANETFTIVRLDATAFTLAIVNGGPGAGTLYTFPISTARQATFTFDGTDWFISSTVGIA